MAVVGGEGGVDLWAGGVQSPEAKHEDGMCGEIQAAIITLCGQLKKHTHHRLKVESWNFFQNRDIVGIMPKQMDL